MKKGHFSQKIEYVTVQKTGSIIFEFIKRVKNLDDSKIMLEWKNILKYALNIEEIGKLICLNDSNWEEDTNIGIFNINFLSF